MTKYAQPRMPARMDLVITALGGNAARIAILGALVQHPLSTPGDLAGHTGLSVNTIRKHLAVLLTAGLIESDPPSSSRSASETGSAPATRSCGPCSTRRTTSSAPRSASATAHLEHATERPPRLESSYSTAAAAAAGEISSTRCTVVTLR
jgi:DNA-binding transcriptional ArsR family regulator